MHSSFSSFRKFSCALVSLLLLLNAILLYGMFWPPLNPCPKPKALVRMLPREINALEAKVSVLENKDLMNKLESCAQDGFPVDIPFLSGDFFRCIADFVFEEGDEERIKFDASKIGFRNHDRLDVVFIKSDFVKEFFEKKYHRIQKPFIVITHNSDYSTKESWRKYLDLPLVVKWYAKNKVFDHPKLEGIPIGILNRRFLNETEAINRERALNVYSYSIRPLSERKFNVYVNFALGREDAFRSKVFRIGRLLSSSLVVPARTLVSVDQYFEQLSDSRFALSPRGSGLDCYRTWESIYVGTIPIVETSNIDHLLDGFPVLVLESWDHLNDEAVKSWDLFNEQASISLKIWMSHWYQEIISRK
jgi:hypothetical protein